MEQEQPFMRLLLGKAFSAYHRLLFGWNFLDTQCGLKLFRREALKKMLPLKTAGFAVDIELIWKALKNNLVVKEVPITWRSNERSTVGPFSDSLKMAADSLKIRFS